MTKYHIYIIGAFVLFSLILNVFVMRKNKKRVSGYLEKYPDAVKVYLKTTNYIVSSSAISIVSIDGEAPYLFNGGFYVKTGKSTIEVRYDSSRVGVFYKNISKTTGNILVEVDLEKNKEYELSFDKNDGEFVIKEK